MDNTEILLALLDRAVKIIADFRYCVDDWNYPVDMQNDIEELLADCFTAGLRREKDSD